MGQAITTLLRRLLCRDVAKSLLSDHPQYCNGEEDKSGFSLWRTVEAIISCLRRLLGRLGPTNPPADPTIPYLHHHADYFIDIGMDSQTAVIGDVANIGSPVILVDDHNIEEGGGGSKELNVKSTLPLVALPPAPIKIQTPVPSRFDARSPNISEVAIRVVDDVDEDHENDVIVESLLPVVPSPAPVSSRWRRGRLGPYSWEQKILLVGEGDFSFSTSLAVSFGNASNMIATSLDSFGFLMKNYERALSNILELTSKECKVMHGVDATKMANHPQLRFLKFDCIVYNFPHAGFANRNAPRDAQIREHQALVRGFLRNAKKMIKDDGQIHITHKCVGFLREWNLEMLGSTEGLRLVEEAPFCHRDYPGYRSMYGYGGGKYFNCNPSRRYKFQLATSP